MSLPTTIEHIKMGVAKTNGKTIYYSAFNTVDAALRSTKNTIGQWVCMHPSIPFVMVVRPVDAERIVRAGGKIIVG